MLENRHDADAIWNQRGGQERKHPDKDASERIKCVASDRGRTKKGEKTVTVQPAAQDAARFKDKGKLLLDKVAARHKPAAIGEDSGC